MIRILDQQTVAVLKQIKQSLAERPDSVLTRQTRLLESIPGAGFLTAVTIVCEVGDFTASRRPKQLYSYFGLEPTVRQFTRQWGIKASCSAQLLPGKM